MDNEVITHHNLIESHTTNQFEYIFFNIPCVLQDNGLIDETSPMISRKTSCPFPIILTPL